MDRSSKLDSYIMHTFEAQTTRRRHRAESGLESAGGAEPETIPVLVRVDREKFVPADISGFKLVSDLGTILAATCTAAAIGALQRHEGVISVEAGRDGMIEEVPSFEFVGGTRIQSPPRSEDGAHAIVGVVDSGIDVLHEAFRGEDGTTRIEAVWDQRDNTGPNPKSLGLTSFLDFGTVYLKTDIDGFITENQVPERLTRDFGGHGTHVASIAAGRAAGDFTGGMAPAARIIVVKPQLKTAEGDVETLGNSVGHVAALNFIDALATKLKLPVVVNASLGMNAGAHDGSSLLETAFDEFSSGGRRAGRCVVKSAGNERSRKVHAQIGMMPGVTETLEWSSRAEHYSPDSVELWFPSEDAYRFSLIDPSGTQTVWVDRNHRTDKGELPKGAFYAITLDQYFKDNGDTRLLVTVSAGPFEPIPKGLFKLEIFAECVHSTGRIDAWIERDDWRPVEFTAHESDEMTLSIPGTARTVIAVGSIGHVRGIRSSTFSSRGRSRDGRNKPDISAPGEAILAAASGTANGVKPDTGTSMAAPHVSGAVALAMSRCKRDHLRIPNAMQIAAGLRGTARNFSGHHTTTFGYGVLDAEAFFDAMTRP